MVIRGSTVVERRAARAARTVKRRIDFYTRRIRAARNGREQLQHACDFARAVGDALGDDGRREMAREIAVVADRRNQP